MHRFQESGAQTRGGHVILSCLTALALATAYLALTAPPARAAGPTAVTLEFDNGAISQYALAYQQALQPHGAKATFFVNSGTVGASGSFMTWAQLGTLAAAGNDIGGKSVNSANLTTDANPKTQVCNDRAAIMQHGLTPAGFAYPGGANNATVQAIVKDCQYGSARTAGGVSPGGAVETLPPANWYATKAYAPGAVTLTNMQSVVAGADSRGGGWAQIVIGRVCSSTLDPGNYSACSAASGHIELADLNAFLDWMTNAGQPGGAPAGAALSPLSRVVGPADASTPATTIACNAAPCADTPYADVVSVTLAPTDTGSGIASTHYTVDGTDPTQSSPTYTGAFNVNSSNSSTTVKFRSWDYAGNMEPVRTQVIQAPADTTPPTTTISCNDAACGATAYVETVTVKLTATDTGGSGVAKTYYTIDGSTPTSSSAVYSAAFTLPPGTYVVQFFSTDVAGTAEQVRSQQVSVAPATTRVSLTFDAGAISQYTLGYQQALKPHTAPATFFVNSGTVGVGTNIMSWSQLQSLATAGNDIGGRSVSSTNLTTDADPTTQVCSDRDALLQHGLTPVAFAYPAGAFNATVKTIVKGCGYGSGRSAGSLSPTGPTYAETLPPADWYATRAYAPSAQMKLTNMQALVNGAASHHGGWSQLVIGRVCSQAQDPNTYGACTSTSGWIELDDLNRFLDWMAAAGQDGGAPAGAALATVRDAVTSADTSAPATTIACNGSPCASSSYPGTVSVTLASTDTGSAVASTHYTTDGTDPSLSSSTYTRPIPLTGTTTVKFRSWDHAGNAEAVRTQIVQVDQSADSTPPTTTIGCNGLPCSDTPYTGTVTVSLTASDGGWGVDKTYYTTDGSAPSTSSTVYTAAFTVTSSATVRFFSTDLAGNSEGPRAQQLLVQPYTTRVALTFDDQYATVYQYLRPMLRARGMNITIYTITDDSTGPFPCCMSYAQLRTMQNEGDDIGGHGRNHLDLTDPSTTTAQKTEDVCGGRQDLMDNGVSDPSSFAYPFGKVNAAAEAIVRSCGFDTARQGGGLASSTSTPGPRYAEALPLQDPYAMRAIDVDAPSSKSLADMQAFVSAAAAHGGGLLPITFHEVCDRAMPDYASCMSTWSAVDTDVLRQFLDWLAAPGQDGGAPAGVVVQTVREAVNSPDSAAPSTVARCNGSPCLDTPYGASLRVSLTASDQGGVGVRGTFYTTDGSTPTQASRVYSEPILLLSSTTVKFFSIDNAGNAEAMRSVDVQVAPNPEPVVAAAGDIACDPTTPSFHGGNGTTTDCRAKGTSNLLVGADAVLPLGDDQYNCGGYDAFMQSYDPTWGRFKSLTHPVPGDKEYATSGGTDCSATPGGGYFQYFGGAAGDPGKGYYSYDLGTWHVIALNTGPCETTANFCAAGSAQEQWLQQDLAAHASASCTLAYYQTPRFASSSSGGSTTAAAIWSDLYTGGADVVLNGDAHWYERLAPVDAAGTPDSAHGVQQFIVGTGGAGLSTPATQLSTSLVLDSSTHGVIRFVLHDGSYSWSFLHDTDGALTDSGTAGCHSAPAAPPEQIAPSTTVSCNAAPCSDGWYNGAVQVALAATDTGGSGVDKTYYTTDGSAPSTSSAVATAPFTVSSTTTVRYFSVDKAGNAEAEQSRLIRVDTTKPTTAIKCNNAACSTGWYAAPVKLTLPAADDAAGSGVAATYYTTDGTTPTRSSTAYTGTAFTVPATSTVKYFSVDTAGNAEATGSQLIRIDSTAPTTNIRCNGTGCAGSTYSNAVTVTLTATDNTGGSGIASTHYTTDGSVPTLSSPTYSAGFSVATPTTVRYRSWDVAGNVEATKSQTIQVVADQAPVARLSVTPSTGTSPLTVTADASGSSDTDSTPIASYTFTFGDGTAAITQSTARATHTYTQTGTFTVTVTVRDTANLAGTVTQRVTVKKK